MMYCSDFVVGVVLMFIIVGGEMPLGPFFNKWEYPE
jgi:hypothetical protein